MVNYTPKVLGIRKEPEAQDVLVRDIMQRAFVSFSEDMDVIEASKMLVKHRITGAPVLNERRELLGFLSEKDCLHFTMDCKYHNNAPGTVSDYMSRTIISLSPTSDIYRATDLFTENTFYSYPVIDDGIVVGIVYRHTVLATLLKMAQSTF